MQKASNHSVMRRAARARACWGMTLKTTEKLFYIHLPSYNTPLGINYKIMATSIYDAVWENDLERIKCLLETPGLEADDEQVVYTPLFYAIVYNRIEAAVLLLAAGANVNWTSTRWCTPIQKAASRGYKDMVILLLQAGADIEASTPRFPHSPLACACYNGNRDVVRLLIESGADVNRKMVQANSATKPLHYAVNKEKADIVELLLAAGAHVDGYSKDGETNDRGYMTPLQLAVRNGEGNCVRALLAAHADPNLATECGFRTALFDAVDNAIVAPGIVADLVKYGANVMHKNKRGFTPLQELSAQHLKCNFRKLSTYCAVVSLLVAAGDRNWGCVPLFCPGIERALLPVWRAAPQELPQVYKRLDPVLQQIVHVCLHILHNMLPEHLRMMILGAVLN